MCSMKKYNLSELLITGIGVTSAIGQGKQAFSSSLMQGRHTFGILQRPGRQNGTSFIGAEIPSLSYPDSFSKRALRTASFSGHVAMITVDEAWIDAKLNTINPQRIGLVVGGTNFQQRELLQIFERYKDRSHFVPPTYGLTFMDSDVCGLCTEHFGIQGVAYTIGAASASGQMAILHAIKEIEAGNVDICLAMGTLMDISHWECQALRSLGAMGSDRYGDDPAMACRPFDRNRDGFIYGESCGTVVIERSDTARRRDVKPYARILSGSTVIDGNRNANPSYEGEVSVITKALKQAKISAQQVDYINPHATGSIIGDEIELSAIRTCRLNHAYINATKSITGHGLSSAGTVEIIATLLQMKASLLHPTRNLENPIDESFRWVQKQAVPHSIEYALNLSMGFGGVNSAICLQKH